MLMPSGQGQITPDQEKKNNNKKTRKKKKKAFRDKTAPLNFFWAYLNWQKDFAPLQHLLSDSCEAFQLASGALPEEIAPHGVTAGCDSPGSKGAIKCQAYLMVFSICFSTSMQHVTISREANLCDHLCCLRVPAIPFFQPTACFDHT